jgi:hypothetical protein
MATGNSRSNMQDERPRPEDAGDASLYYDKSEATRYHTCQEVVQKQLELTARALEFLGLSLQQQAAAGGSSRPLIADIGCGKPLLLLAAAHPVYDITLC